MLAGRLFRRALLRGKASRTSQARLASARAVPSDFADVSIPNVLLHEKVLENLPNWASHTALADSVTERKYSFDQLDKLSGRVAAGLLRSGLKPGQVVSLVLPNLPEFILAALGVLRAGLTVTTVNPLYGPDEILHQVKDSESALILTYPQKVKDVQTAIGRLQTMPPPIAVIHAPGEELPTGTRSFLELFGNPDISPLDMVKVDPGSVAFLLYSSGTTGLPKGVRLTHRNVVANVAQIGCPHLLAIRPTTKDFQDVAACVLPFFHVFGLVIGAFAHLIHGVKIVTLPKFEKNLFLEALTTHKCTIAHVVPPIAQFLGNHPDVKPSHLDSLNVLMNGAAALSKTDGNRIFEKKKDLFLASGYGLTESSPVITAPKLNFSDLDSVGYILPNTQIKIINTESGDLIDPNTPGEICVFGPQIMDGYHNNKEATAKTVIDGWLHTGDVGFLKEGRLFIVDRLKELIKVKGFQVAPMEIEELLRSHPGVADVGVVGKPDARLGETPVAFVVASSKTPSAQDLKDFVASKLVDYKQLSDVIFLDSIPKNLTGKILRRQLKEKLPKS